MKKTLPIILLFFIQSLTLLAQSDSLAVVQAKWQQKKIAKGVSWKTIHFQQHEIFSSNQYISIIEISPKAKKVRLHMAYSDSLQKTSDLAQIHQALAAVNGSFFKMRGADPDHNPNLKDVPKSQPSKIDRNRSVVYLRVQDSLITENTFAKDSLRRRHQQGVIAINNDTLLILGTDAKNLTWERTLEANDIVASGPIMLLNGKYQPIPNDAFCNDRHPRTAIGKKADGTIILFVVDGRMQQAIGMSIPELQKTMRWLGCSEAINLDGGGSTAMYVKGEPENGVVNHPSDNKVFDHKGEREVANVLLLLPIRKRQK